MALVGDNGAGKSTLIKCVAGIHPMDSGQIFFDGKPVSIHSPKDGGQSRDRGRLPGSRALRQPRRRPEHVPRPRGARLVPAAQGAADGGEDGRDAEDARGHDDQVDPPAGRNALRRPAAVGRRRPRGDVELAARDPRRADRRPRRLADRAGAAARRAPRRAGPRGHPDLAQPPRHLRGRRRASRCCVSAGTSASTSARRRPRRRSCTRSRPGSRPRCPGIPGPATERPRERRRRRRLDRAGDSRATGTAFGLNVRTGNLGNAPVIIALLIVILYFSLTTTNWFTPVNFTNLIGQLAGVCMLAYGVVFVLLIGEIDLSIAFVSGIAGVVVAELQLPTGAHLPGLVCILLALLTTTADRGVPGLVRRVLGRSVVRGHARRLPDLAGRDPAHDHAGRDRHPGQHDQQRLRLLLRRHGRLDHGHHHQRRVHGRHARGRALGPSARDPDPRSAALRPEAGPHPG